MVHQSLSQLRASLRAGQRHPVVFNSPLTRYRDRLYNLVKELNPAGVEARTRKAHRHRGTISVPGPNHAWSIDGHCKLDAWGIEVYAAIDTYSRYIIWIYVGLSAHTAISVAAQYLATLASGGVMPLFLRSDYGSETSIIADLHLHLSDQLRTREDGQPLEFTDCFRYGTSKKNQRIERWWAEQSQSATGRWRDHFTQLTEAGDYSIASQWDRIAMLYVYMPILRTVIMEFTSFWNREHSIRTQKERSHVVSGIPYLNYAFPTLHDEEVVDLGVPVPPEMLEELHQELEGLGKQLAASLAVYP